MAKRQDRGKAIISEIAKLPQCSKTNGRSAWYHVLQDNHPEEYEAIVTVLRDFYSRGPTYHTFLYITHLHRYLTGKDPDRPLSPPLLPPDVSASRFAYFAKNFGNGKA